MQVGWRDPSNGREESFEYWLARAEEDGSALGYPYEVLLGMAQQAGKRDRPDGFTVTMLAKCARAVFIDGTVDHYADPVTNYAAFRGVIGHAMLEKSQHPGAVVERRIYRMFDGEPLSGQLDKFRIRVPGWDSARQLKLTEDWLTYLDAMFAEEMLEPTEFTVIPPELPEGAVFEVQDWKTKDKVPFGIYVYDHHKQQGNVYRWLLRAPKDRTDIEFVYVSMSEVKTIPVHGGGKFANGRQKPDQILTDAEVESLIADRLGTLVKQRDRNRALPYDKVPVADLWECQYCPVRDICYERAAEEARQAFEAGKPYLRITPRNPEDEKKVKLPGKKTKDKE